MALRSNDFGTHARKSGSTTFIPEITISQIRVDIYVNLYSRTSIIHTPKGQSKVSVFERFPVYRGRYDDVTFKTPVRVKDVKTGPL